MSRNNKGYILVSTVIFFSIISIVCAACISLVYSNNNYSKLEYEYIRMKELSLSGIEIARSNILKVVKDAITNSNNEVDFNKYLQGNKMYSITDLSESELNNVFVTIEGTVVDEKDSSLAFTMISNCKNGEYNKKVRVNVKINNPWILHKEKNNNYKDDEAKLEFDQIESENELEKIQDTKDEFNEKELVIIYNYREL